MGWGSLEDSVGRAEARKGARGGPGGWHREPAEGKRAARSRRASGSFSRKLRPDPAFPGLFAHLW